MTACVYVLRKIPPLQWHKWNGMWDGADMGERDRDFVLDDADRERRAVLGLCNNKLKEPMVYIATSVPPRNGVLLKSLGHAKLATGTFGSLWDLMFAHARML